MSLLNRISAVEVVVVTRYHVRSIEKDWLLVGVGGSMNVALFAVEFGSENAISSRLSPRKPRFNLGRIRVGFVMDRVALGRVLSPSTLVFPSHYSTNAPYSFVHRKCYIIITTSAPNSLVRKVCVCLNTVLRVAVMGWLHLVRMSASNGKPKKIFPAAVVISHSSQSYPNKSYSTRQHYITQK